MPTLRRFYICLALVILFTHVTSHADCEKYLTQATRAYSNSETDIIDLRIQQLEKSLHNLPAKNVEFARHLLNALARDGSPIDIDIFETLLKLNPGKPQAEAKPNLRPRSPYIRAHENWLSLMSYFFDSPSALTVTRTEDLNFLRHLAGTGPSEQAQRSWHLARLSRFPKVRAAFEQWENDRTLKAIQTDVLSKLKGLASESNLERLTLNPSSFDLFVIDKYLEQARGRKVSQRRAAKEIDHSLQLTDWRTFASNLAEGSLNYVIEFTDASSHDTELKAYLLSILLKMESSSKELQDREFRPAFENARWHVDGEIEDVPPPEQYQSNMSVFTLVGKRDPMTSGNPFSTPIVAEIQVQWNPKLARLEAWLANSLPVRSNLRVRDNPQLAQYLTRYFDYFREGSDYNNQEIDQHFQYEMASSLVRNTYIVFTRPGFPMDALATVKIFNGSPIEFADGQLQRSVNEPDEMQSSIEHMFPHLVFEERRKGVSVREIGRMLAVPDETKPHAFGILMARVADLLYSSGARGSAYFYGVKKVRDHHVREGAEVIYSPEDLNLSPDAEPKWVMRMAVRDMAARYFTQIFEAIRLRRPPAHFLVDGPPPEIVHSHVQFNGPEGFHADAAILQQDEGEHTLLITHREGNDARYQPIIDNPNLGLTLNGMAGTESSLQAVDGKLVIHQQNQSIGRHRWERYLHIELIDGEYLVTRFEYSHRDTLVTEETENCDYDLINGTGALNGQPVNIAKSRIKLKSLRDHEALYTCSGW